MTSIQTSPTPHTLPRLHDPDLLIYIRHGQTDWNAEGRMQGQRDIPLNAIGRGQAESNGRRLKAFLEAEGLHPDAFDFVSSPLGRTRSTMELLRSAMGLEADGYGLFDGLKEITFGDWEGFTLEELGDGEQELVLKRRADKWGFVYPGGESYEQLSKRIGAWLTSIDRPTVVVSHGAVFRVVRGLLEGLDTGDVPRVAVPQDRIFVWRKSRFEEI